MPFLCSDGHLCATPADPAFAYQVPLMLSTVSGAEQGRIIKWINEWAEESLTHFFYTQPTFPTKISANSFVSTYFLYKLIFSLPHLEFLLSPCFSAIALIRTSLFVRPSEGGPHCSIEYPSLPPHLAYSRCSRDVLNKWLLTDSYYFLLITRILQEESAQEKSRAVREQERAGHPPMCLHILQSISSRT